MKIKSLILAATVACTTGLGFAADTTMPEAMTPEAIQAAMPKPGPQHQWLKQFVGEWKATSRMWMDPSQPPMEAAGVESTRPFGDFWTVTEMKGSMSDVPYRGQMALSYDQIGQKYVGTWFDSMSGQLMTYQGTMDPSGKVLTLETQGHCPMRPGKLTSFRDVIEMKDNDHKMMTSFIQDDNGNWIKMMESTSMRVK